MSLRPVAARLGELLGSRRSAFAEDCVGPAAEPPCSSAPPGGVVLLENLRFHPEEEKNDAGVREGAGRACRRLRERRVRRRAPRARVGRGASSALMPEAGAGLLMEKELRYLGEALGNPERPFVAILGGAKVSDKIEVIENLIPRVDRLLIGGAMAYTFFKAMGKPVGRSLVEDDKLDAARDIMTRATGARASAAAARRSRRRAEARGRRADRDARAWTTPAIGERMGLDIGPTTVAGVRRRARATRRPWCGTGRWACSRSTPSPRARSPWRRPSPR